MYIFIPISFDVSVQGEKIEAIQIDGSGAWSLNLEVKCEYCHPDMILISVYSFQNFIEYITKSNSINDFSSLLLQFQHGCVLKSKVDLNSIACTRKLDQQS